jgi:uncharacterized protein YcaQ
MGRARRESMSNRDARQVAIEAQGLAAARPKRRAGARTLAATVDAIGVVQLDAINVLDRTQFLVLFSRLGAFDKAHLHAVGGPHGELFEYWGHAASLLPVALQPLFRWRMTHGGHEGGPTLQARRAAYVAASSGYIRAVLDEVRDRGPLTAGQLADPRRREGEWWGRRSLGRVALEHLFAHGELAGWRAPNFERVYDLPERVIPNAVLAAPTPSIDDATRALVARSARALGVATVRDLATYYFLKVDVTKARVGELVDAGTLTAVDVEGWKERGYVHTAATRVRTRRDHATLLSPFDSLIWDRARTSRLFRFDYRIEVYTPAPKRKFGYYVMPLLFDDALVGRFDLKAERKTSTLLVQAAHAERGVDVAGVAPVAAGELHALRSWLGLERISVVRRGNLAVALARAVK